MKQVLLISLFLFLSACAVPGLSVTPASTIEGLIEQMKAAGLEVEQIAPIKLEPGMVGAVKFYTPSLCDDCSSVVMIFENEGKALEIMGQLELAGQISEALGFHLYRNKRVLLRMGGLIEKGQADKYAAAIGLD